MNRLTNSILFIFVFVFVFLRADAQNLPEYNFKMLENDTLSFELFSKFYPYEVAPFTQFGDLDYPSEPPVQNFYPITYIPDQGFTGVEEFVFQYRGDPGNGYFTSAVKYSKFTIEVLPSVLSVNADDIVINMNSAQVEIDVLANDVSTADNLLIEELTNIEGGIAVISADNTVYFDVEAGFVGVAYLNYLVSDDAGSTDLAQVSIQVVDPDEEPTTEEISLATLNTKALKMLLPSNDFELDGSIQASLGEVLLDGNYEVTYVPNLDIEGIDTFMINNSEQNRYYYIEVYDIPNDGHAVVDDRVFTLQNEEVIFNVNDNDYLDNYMDEWTQPDHGYINYLGNGTFSYMPDEDYRGYDEFTYTKRVAPIVFQTAIVRIGVGNFNPVQLEEYNLNALKNQAVVVNYDIPVQDYVFTTINAPENGTLTIYEGWQTVTIGCNTVSGYNLVIYEPNQDFSGGDEFEIDYCPGDTDCQLIKVHVEVYDEVLDPDCPCVGSDCVWKGDTNGDGVVDVRDILPIGLFMGAEGDIRESDSEEWLGFNSSDWNGEQGQAGKNLKHIDTDGNGIINAHDTTAISQNYDNLHTILAKGVNAIKPYPLYLTTSQDSVKKGDYLNLVIEIGDADFPVIDLSGVTYNLQFPPDLIDSSSLIHEFFTEGWFANASSTLQLHKQPLEGKIDAGFTRIGGIGASGHGPIAKCDFIVEDDIHGLKLKSSIIPLTISLDEAVVMDKEGNYYQLPATQKTIYLDLRDKEEAPLVDELIVYPNPAGDYINIHMNGINTIERINVYTATGMLLETLNLNNSSNNTKLDIYNYHTGVYFIEVYTPKGKTAQRFEVIK